MVASSNTATFTRKRQIHILRKGQNQLSFSSVALRNCFRETVKEPVGRGDRVLEDGYEPEDDAGDEFGDEEG